MGHRLKWESKIRSHRKKLDVRSELDPTVVGEGSLTGCQDYRR
jgi:hypothetical protein